MMGVSRRLHVGRPSSSNGPKEMERRLVMKLGVWIDARVD